MIRFHERRKKTRQSPYADVQVELTHMVFAGLLPTIVLGGIGMVGATAILAFHYKDHFLGWLSLAMTLACAARAVCTYLFLKRSGTRLSLLSANRWELSYGCLNFAYTALLAISTLYNFAYHDYVARLWCVLGTAVFCAAFSSGLSLRPWLAMAPGVVMLLALAVSVLRSEEALVRWTTLLILIYAFQYRQSITTKFDIIVDQVRIKRQLRNLAEHDALTGLANRRQFHAALALACRQQARLPSCTSISIDSRQSTTPAVSHAVGDRLLRAVADRLLAIVRDSDLVARLGGDEFAVLQHSPADDQSAATLATRINHEIAKTFLIESHALQIGASVGIRLKTPNDTDPSALMTSADSALYAVKQQGRGGFSFANSETLAPR